MPTRPFIIFLPVRNGGAYLREAVDSIVAQNDPDWRLIVLENDSTDDTPALLGQYDDARIEVVRSDRPLDICGNWHRVWEWLEANDTTDALVTTIGHDDCLNPGFVSGMRQIAADHPGATLYHSAFDLIDSTGKLIRPCRPVPAEESWQDLAAALCWGIRDSYGTGYVFRARDFRRVGGFPNFPSLLYADHILFIRLAKLGYKRADTTVLCRYRLHAGSASSSLSGRTLNDYVEALDCFTTALTGEMETFTHSALGRNSLSCLIGRQIVSLGRPAVQPLLSAANRDRMERFNALFTTLSPELPPEAWVERKGSRSVRRLESLIDRIALTRVRWRERRAG